MKNKYSVRPIAFRPEWVEILGDIKTVILYQQLYYWSDKGGRGDGWIYKTVKDLEYETTIEEDTQTRIIKKLKETGWIDTKLIKVESDNRLRRHFMVLRFLDGLPAKCGGVYPQNAGGDTAECGTSSYTKSTSEITTKKEEGAIALKNNVITTTFDNLEQEKLSSLVAKGIDENFAKRELAKFVSYWTETNQRGKQRWQGEKYFDINKRIATWFQRAIDGNKPKVTVHMQAPRGVGKL